MWRMGQLFSALLSLVLLLIAAAVAWTPVTSAAPGYDAGPTPSSGVPQPSSAPALNWGNCSRVLSSPGDVPSAQCATVPVPVDYGQPGGAQVQLAVIRIPATGPRIGALLINPGGPGASAVDMVAAMGPQLAGSEISRRFDLVGFDPRGVGHSTPSLRCQSDADFDAYRREPMVDYSPQGVAHIEQVYRQLAQRCLARNGPAFLENVGTASVARDMDAVRQA
ncbi:MAG: alpha/beta fold hydrolase, partial [Mycobacterium sp.]